LQGALDLQRAAQWRLDFIAAENSMGFHAPQEAARVLGEAADYARQGQLVAVQWRNPPAVRPAVEVKQVPRDLPQQGGGEPNSPALPAEATKDSGHTGRR
jgi:nitrite reductase (cytochrome c-552)